MRLLAILVLGAALALSLLPGGPARAQTLTSGVWQLEQLLDETDIPSSTWYTIEFDSDGTVEIEADCNRASGRWASKGSGLIDITVTLQSRASCPSPSLEAEFLDQLDDVTEYEFSDDDDTLTLTGPDGDLLFEPGSA